MSRRYYTSLFTSTDGVPFLKTWHLRSGQISKKLWENCWYLPRYGTKQTAVDNDLMKECLIDLLKVTRREIHSHLSDGK